MTETPSLTPFIPRVPKPVKRVMFAAFIAAVVYVLVGFLVLPHAARFILNHLLQTYVSVPASVTRIEFNPFTGELGVYDAQVGETDKEKLAFTRLWVDLQIDSVWTGALHLQSIELDNVHLAAQLSQKGKLDLLEILRLPKAEKKAAEKEDSKRLFPVRIDRVQANGAMLHWQDLRQDSKVDIRVAPLTLTLGNISTLTGEPGKLQLQANAGKAGKLELEADYTIPERRAKGHIQIQGSHLQQVWPYVQAQVPLRLTQGRVDLSLEFLADAGKTLHLNIDNGKLALHSLALSDKKKTPMLSLARLNVEPMTASLHEQRVQIGSIVAEGIEAPVIREADGRLNWQRLFAAPQPRQSPMANTPAASGNGKAAAKPWTISIPDIQLNNAKIEVRDDTVVPPKSLDVKLTQLRVRHFESSNKLPLALSLDTQVGEEGRLQAEGQFDVAAKSAQIQLISKQLDLRLAQPYVKPFVRLEIRSGLLDTQLQLDVPRIDPLTLKLAGDVTVNQLHTIDTLKNQDLLKWQQLQLQGLTYQHDERLDIQAVKLKAPYMRFVINENLSTNVSELMVPQKSATPSAPAQAVTTKEGASADKQKALAIHIAGIDIEEGSANFADFSLTPNFATAIAQLNGSVGTLDNQQNAPATLNIKGKVDRYAPVSIVGSLTPFDPLNRLDINAKFKRVELTTLTPYSGKFAGYRIRKGRLNLDLHYEINEGQLTAKNKVVLEELQLGEKVDSPDAVDLPVRLAVALLKDSHGNIKVELPIEGDLNNPKFSVGPVLWKTLRNLIVRAVKSPFSFISGLLKSDESENLDDIAFAPGSSELTETATTKLKTVASALKDRPLLRLEVEGASAQRTDGEPLAQQLLTGELRKVYAKRLQQRGQKVSTDDESLDVPDNDKPALLMDLYGELFEKPVPANWVSLPESARNAELQQTILEHLGESERRLRQLARERAAAIKSWLVEEGGLADQRIYLLNAQLRDDKPGKNVTCMLYLDSE